MRIVATPEVVEHVRARGGLLYVWVLPMEYGYHPVFVLETSFEPPGPVGAFQRFEGEGIELLLDVGGRDLPESIHLDLSGIVRRRVRATWNGHSFTPG